MNFTQQSLPACAGVPAGMASSAATPTMAMWTMTITTPGAWLA